MTQAVNLCVQMKYLFSFSGFGPHCFNEPANKVKRQMKLKIILKYDKMEKYDDDEGEEEVENDFFL